MGFGWAVVGGMAGDDFEALFFAVEDEDFDAGFGGYAQGHVFEFVVAAAGPIFVEAFVVDIEFADACLGNVFDAVGAGRVGDEDGCAFGGFAVCVCDKDAVCFGVDGARGIADFCLAADGGFDGGWPVVCTAKVPVFAVERAGDCGGDFVGGVRAAADNVNGSLHVSVDGH